MNLKDVQVNDAVLVKNAKYYKGAWCDVREISSGRMKLRNQVDRRDVFWTNGKDIVEHTPRGQ